MAIETPDAGGRIPTDHDATLDPGPGTTGRPARTLAITRGIRRGFVQRGYASVAEVSLKNSRRADVLALGSSGDLVIVEVKSGPADFLSDGKWPDYTGYCDRFYFGVDADFPQHLIPEPIGLIVADAHESVVVREARAHPLAAARRKAMLLRFAIVAAQRLTRLEDPLMPVA